MFFLWSQKVFFKNLVKVSCVRTRHITNTLRAGRVWSTSLFLIQIFWLCFGEKRQKGWVYFSERRIFIRFFFFWKVFERVREIILAWWVYYEHFLCVYGKISLLHSSELSEQLLGMRYRVEKQSQPNQTIDGAENFLCGKLSTGVWTFI